MPHRPMGIATLLWDLGIHFWIKNQRSLKDKMLKDVFANRERANRYVRSKNVRYQAFTMWLKFRLSIRFL